MTFQGRRTRTFDVCAKRCDQCLFSKAKIVSDARRDELLKDIAKNDNHFMCHKHSIAGRDVVCRGDYDRDPLRTMVGRLAKYLNIVTFLDAEGNETEP
jgi:hypothetical protein